MPAGSPMSPDGDIVLHISSLVLSDLVCIGRVPMAHTLETARTCTRQGIQLHVSFIIVGDRFAWMTQVLHVSLWRRRPRGATGASRFVGGKFQADEIGIWRGPE